MHKIDLTQFDERDNFTIKLKGPPGLIASDTLTETVAGISQSLRAINAAVSPHSTLEVYFTGSTPGSMNIGIRLKQHFKKNAKTYAIAAGTALAASTIPVPVLPDIIVGLLTSFLYDQIKQQRERYEVDVSDDKVTIRGGDFQITVPRQVYELKPRIEHDRKVVEGIQRTLAAVKKDPAVESFGVAARPDTLPAVEVPREQFDEALQHLAERAKSRAKDKTQIDVEGTSAVIHQSRDKKIRTMLTVIKCGLQRGRSKWGFSWQGVAVSAQIADASFFASLLTREVALRLGIREFNDDFRAQLQNPSVRLQVGDTLDADLKITQQFHADAEVWVNHAYVVPKVYVLKRGGIVIDFAQSFKSTHLASSATAKFPPTVGDA